MKCPICKRPGAVKYTVSIWCDNCTFMEIPRKEASQAKHNHPAEAGKTQKRKK